MRVKPNPHVENLNNIGDAASPLEVVNVALGYDIKSADVSDVTTLSLSNLGLTEIPQELSRFTNVKRLDLSGNKLRFVSVWSLPPNLESINLRGNPLEDLPDIPNAPAIDTDIKQDSELPPGFY